MGTLLTLETIRMLRAEAGEAAMSRIGAVVLAAPDIDFDLFSNGVARLGPDVSKITVISSTNDRALELSAALAGGVRAGAADRAKLEALGVRVADASDYGGGLINHDLFLSNPEVQAWSSAPSPAAPGCERRTRRSARPGRHALRRQWFLRQDRRGAGGVEMVDPVGPDPEADQGIGAERVGERDVGGVAAVGDHHPADPRLLLRGSKTCQRPPR